MASSTAGSVASGRHHRHRRHWHHQHHNHTSEHEGAHTDTAEGGGGRFGPRSQSLSALQPSVIQPRMAQLENLEAKMASIEVSLSSAPGPRRRKGAASPGPRTNTTITVANKENSTTKLSTPRQQTHVRTAITNSAVNERRSTPAPTVTGEREERLRRLKNEADSKRTAIKAIKLALDRLDITDNIDVRIRQAELEYQLGREELNLLTITEEIRRLQHEQQEEEMLTRRHHGHGGHSHSNGLGDGDECSLYSTVSTAYTKGNKCELISIEAAWDNGGPRFGVCSRNGNNNIDQCGGPGLLVEWCAEGCGLRRGDRVLEVNGRLVPSGGWSREDLARVLASRPEPARLAVLRNCSRGDKPNPGQQQHQGEVLQALRAELGLVKAGAEEARKAKDGLRADNLRLTHRISYLEEQVQELLNRQSERQSEERTKPPCVTSVVDLGSGEVHHVYGSSRISGGGARSVRSLDLDLDYTSEPSPLRPGARRDHHGRPQPPKKPLRLSLHRRAQSLQSVDASTSPPPTANTVSSSTGSASVEQAGRKRTHRGECPAGAIRWSTSNSTSAASAGRTRTHGKW